MGGGASKRKGQAAGAAEPPAAGPKLPDNFSGDPAICRRRRLLFRGDKASRKFEAVEPKRQFDAPQDEPDDPTFKRLSPDEVKRFRGKAQEESKKNGYLGKTAIALLGLELEPKSYLCDRLFNVCQVQTIEGGKRRAAMTCYELMSMHGLIRYGEIEDLLEFLFCVFDSDQDDHLTKKDLAAGVLAFLELPEASANLDEAGKKDFKQLNGKGRKREARRIADLAIQTYATASDFEETDRSSVDSSPPSSPDPSSRQDASKLTDGPSSIKDEEEPLDNLSTTPAATGGPSGEEPAPKTQPRRRGLCRGKPPADDSQSEGENAPLNPTSSMQTQTGQPKKQPRRGLCSGKPPADDKSSDGEQTPRKKPPPAAKRQGSCMGGSRKKKGPPALTYSQWLQWLAVSGLMPADLSEVAAEIVKAEASKSFMSGGSHALEDRASGSDNRTQSSGRLAALPAPTAASSSAAPPPAEQPRIASGAGAEPFPQQQQQQKLSLESNVVGSMTRSFDDDEDSSNASSPERGNRQMKAPLLGS